MAHQVIDGDLYLHLPEGPPPPIDHVECTDGYYQVPKYNVPKAKALMAAGYTVPHPIHDPSIFEYSGKFTPYMRQRETAGFLSWNDRAWCLNDMGCVDKETEYLTPNGWKKITDYKEGDLVAQYDVETNSTKFVAPKGYVDLPNPSGTMLEFYGPWNATQVVTPDHTMLVEGTRKGHYRPMKASELVKKIATRKGGSDCWGKFNNCYGTDYRAKRSFNLEVRDTLVNASPENFTAAVLMLMCWGHDPDSSAIYVPDYLEKDLPNILKPVDFSPNGEHIKVLAESVHQPHFYLVGIDIAGGMTYNDLLISVLQSPKHWGAKLARKLVHHLQDRSIYSGRYAVRRLKHGKHVCTNLAKDAFTTILAEFGGQLGRNSSHRPKEIDGDRSDWQIFRFIKGATTAPKDKLPQTWSRYYEHSYRVVQGQARKYCFVTDTGYWVAKRKHHIYVTGNTGKTASAIWATEFLRQTEGLRKTLILTTLSTMDVVWKQELFQLYPTRSAAVVVGDKKRKLMLIKQPYKYLILNHDGFKQPYLLEAILALEDLDLVILDEASGFRNHSTARYKALAKLIRSRPNLRFWPMTGTPAPQAPTDVWALSRLVNPEGTPPYFQRFKQQTMMKVSAFEWVPRPESSAIVQRVMQPAIRVKVEDCDDIPKLMPPTRVEAEMSEEQNKYFSIMRDQMVMEYRSRDANHVVTAVNAAVLMTKLMQICCGNLYDIDKNTIHLRNDKRLKATFDAAIEAGASSQTKVIIFVPFKHSQRAVLDYFNNNGLKAVLVNGDTPAKDRRAIFDDFQMEGMTEDNIFALPPLESTRVLIAHPRVAAHGLTLTAASCIIWFAPYASLEYTQQANARIARTGQTQKHLRVVHIGSHPIEWRMYNKLEKKGALQSDILNLYENLMNQGVPT